MTFAIDPRALRGLVPVGTEIDTFDDGRAPLSMVALRFDDSRVLGLPIPFARSYDQVALRFYVRRWLGGDRWRRGTVPVIEFVPVSALVSAGHVLYGEAYERRPVTSRVRPPDPGTNRGGRAVYRWRTDRSIHRLAVDFSGELHLPAPDSREAFLVERYWGYLARHADLTSEVRVDHPPWRIWSAAEGHLTAEVPQLFGDRFARALASPPVSVVVAEGSRLELHRPITLPPMPPPAPAFV
ncbi:MAG TPA: DUF2071 domain-containing protein [Kofleriaceae bacterium]|nr:DUF2071 domain-containing protein [Kofleriaceae bacterium]